MCKQDGFVYFLGNLCEYLSSVVLCRFERKACKWYIFKSHMQFHALAVMYFAAFFPILFIRYNFILLSNLLNSNFNSLENSERKKINDYERTYLLYYGSAPTFELTFGVDHQTGMIDSISNIRHSQLILSTK